MEMASIVITAVLLALQVADVLTTNRVLARGGREVNPLMALAMRRLGRLWWVPKAGLVGGAVAAAWLWLPPPWLVGVLGLIVLGYGIVAANNHALSRRRG